MKKILMMAAVAAIAASTASAQADTVFNTNVVGTGSPPPGILFFGSGNPNGNFTVGNNGVAGTAPTIVLGLRADIAFGSLITPTIGGPTNVDNVYIVPAGVQTGGIDAGDALWDFVYSIDVSGTTSPLTDFVATLTVTDPLGNSSGPLNPLSFNGNGGGTQIAQNAENISFGGGNPNLTGLYTIDLTLNSPTGIPSWLPTKSSSTSSPHPLPPPRAWVCSRWPASASSRSAAKFRTA